MHGDVSPDVVLHSDEPATIVGEPGLTGAGMLLDEIDEVVYGVVVALRGSIPGSEELRIVPQLTPDELFCCLLNSSCFA